jgi:hypothetical protein
VPEFQVKESVDYDVLHFQFWSSSEPLTHINNHSLTNAIFPEKYKFARNKLLQTNISINSDAKILEIIMFKRLEQHLESNNILATEQFGFRKGNAIFTLTDNILTSLNQ